MIDELCAYIFYTHSTFSQLHTNISPSKTQEVLVDRSRFSIRKQESPKTPCNAYFVARQKIPVFI
jgi:hypothetical protein